MKLFTFSGIRAGFGDVNEGLYMKEFALSLIRGWGSTPKPAYNGQDDVGHFRSYVNFGHLLSNARNVIRLDGAPVLDAESRKLSPAYAKAIASEAASSTPAEPFLLLGHSQGTNNLVHTLLYLDRTQPDVLGNRPTRVILFDPKVGVHNVEEVFASPTLEKVDIFFFQSERNLLGNQDLDSVRGWYSEKFIDDFLSGDHLWIRDLDHDSIVDWRTLSRQQKCLTLPGYVKFRRDCRKKLIELRRLSDRRILTGHQFTKWLRFLRTYPYEKVAPKKIVLDFLKGRLAARWRPGFRI